MSSYGQGGTRQWRRVRQFVLDRDLHECQLRLQGCTFIATEVHHKDGIAAIGRRRSEVNDEDLCCAVCPSCHTRMTNKQRRLGIAQAAALRRARLRPSQMHPGELRRG